MARIDDLTKRMTSTMPYPAPTPGDGVTRSPRYGRTRLWAESMVMAEDSDTIALQQLQEGATLQRIDDSPTDWTPDNAVTWLFEPVADAPGASGTSLDRWGAALQVPRYQGETNADYAKRIPATVIAPSTTNFGMAQMIDRLLGFVHPDHTRVVEGINYYATLRLNDFPLNSDVAHTYRANDGNRYMSSLPPGLTSFQSTFVVILPQALPAGRTRKEILDLVDSRRAAGSRMASIVVPV